MNPQSRTESQNLEVSIYQFGFSRILVKVSKIFALKEISIVIFTDLKQENWDD